MSTPDDDPDVRPGPNRIDAHDRSRVRRVHLQFERAGDVQIGNRRPADAVEGGNPSHSRRGHQEITDTAQFHDSLATSREEEFGNDGGESGGRAGLVDGEIAFQHLPEEVEGARGADGNIARPCFEQSGDGEIHQGDVLQMDNLRIAPVGHGLVARDRHPVTPEQEQAVREVDLQPILACPGDHGDHDRRGRRDPDEVIPSPGQDGESLKPSRDQVRGQDDLVLIGATQVVGPGIDDEVGEVAESDGFKFDPTAGPRDPVLAGRRAVDGEDVIPASGGRRRESECPAGDAGAVHDDRLQSGELDTRPAGDNRAVAEHPARGVGACRDPAKNQGVEAAESALHHACEFGTEFDRENVLVAGRPGESLHPPETDLPVERPGVASGDAPLAVHRRAEKGVAPHPAVEVQSAPGLEGIVQPTVHGQEVIPGPEMDGDPKARIRGQKLVPIPHRIEVAGVAVFSPGPTELQAAIDHAQKESVPGVRAGEGDRVSEEEHRGRK